MIPNAILLYSYMGVLSSCHRKAFLWQLKGAGAETYSQTLCLNWRSPIGSLSLSLWSPVGEQRKTVAIRGNGGYQENTGDQTNYAGLAQRLTETEVAVIEPAWICPTSSAHMVWLCVLGAFVGLLTVVVKVSMTLSPPLGSSSSTGLERWLIL